MVFYRKYRPQSFDELVGQEIVKKTLLAAITTGSLAHAYLFSGPRGTGKTSTARILAKVVNCEGKDAPCNKCSSCTTITDGTNLDVIEMDAASNRGIEDIRTLRETIKLAPTSSKKKVYIIDEVHMLTTEAFNALLKILEEPPSHVIFILATTDPQKIPQTVLSRVQRLDFKAAAPQELMEALKKVVKSEKLEISEDALVLLSKHAQGSFRDGIKLLDQIASMGKMDAKSAEELISGGDSAACLEILQNIAQKNGPEALKKFLEYKDMGLIAREFNLNLLDLLRSLLLLKNGLGERIVRLEVREEEYKSLEGLAEKFSLKDLIGIIARFQKSLEQARFTSIPSLPLEVAIVESCQTDVIANVVKQSTQDESMSRIATSPSVPRNDEEILAPVYDLEKTPKGDQDDIQKIQDKWTYVLETVKQFNFSLEALLRSAKVLQVDGREIVIEVPYSFHQRMLSAPKSSDLLESILADILGRSVKVSTVLGQKKVGRDDLANVELAADDEIIRLASEIFSSEGVN